MMGSWNELTLTVGDKGRSWARFCAGFLGLAALLGAAGTGLGCGGATDEPECEGAACETVPRACQSGGSTYAEGISRPAGDGCNTCTCQSGGWECTTVGCLNDSCVYDGQIRADGSSFPDRGGCNQCSCDDGEVSCTERDCPPQPRTCELNGQLIASGQSGPAGDGCNGCTCLDGELHCTLIACNVQCLRDEECDDAEYCAFPIDTCFDQVAPGASADAETEELRAPGAGQGPIASGECRPRPTVCTGQDAPVCACDGQTYRSECAAASLGLNLSSAGACPASE